MFVEILRNLHPDAPTLVLSAGLGGSGSFWQPQFASLNEHFHLMIYDHRGTARSGGELPPNYHLRDMANDVVQLLQEHQIQQCYFVGHALGGMIGLQLALDHPHLLQKLVVVNGWPVLDSQTRRCFEVRKDLLLNSGVAAYVRAQPLFLYPADWLSQHATLLAAEQVQQEEHFQGVQTLLSRLQALMNADFRDQLGQITTPTLALSAKDDLLVPYHCSQSLAEALPNGELAEMTYGGHAMSVTNSNVFNRLLLAWLLAPTAHNHASFSPHQQEPL